MWKGKSENLQEDLRGNTGITLEEMDELFIKIMERIKNYGTI